MAILACLSMFSFTACEPPLPPVEPDDPAAVEAVTALGPKVKKIDDHITEI